MHLRIAVSIFIQLILFATSSATANSITEETTSASTSASISQTPVHMPTSPAITEPILPQTDSTVDATTPTTQPASTTASISQTPVHMPTSPAITDPTLPQTDSTIDSTTPTTRPVSTPLSCSCESYLENLKMTDDIRQFQKQFTVEVLGSGIAYNDGSCANDQATCQITNTAVAGHIPMCLVYNGPNNPPNDTRIITWRDCVLIDPIKLPPNQCLNLANLGMPEANRCTCDVFENCNAKLGIPPIHAGPIVADPPGN